MSESGVIRIERLVLVKLHPPSAKCDVGSEILIYIYQCSYCIWIVAGLSISDLPSQDI